jgi:hypothetical protein
MAAILNLLSRVSGSHLEFGMQGLQLKELSVVVPDLQCQFSENVNLEKSKSTPNRTSGHLGKAKLLLN